MRLPSSLYIDNAGVVAAGGGGGAQSGAAQDAAAGSNGGNAAAAAGTPGAAGQAQPKPFFSGLYGDDGKIDKTAFDRLPEHLKGHKELFGKYETVDALLSGFASAHSMAVKKALAPLDPTAPPEVVAERKAHLDAINNVPKDLKGYGIARPQDLPEMFWNEESAGKFAQLAQKHSLSPAAVKELFNLQLETTRGEITKGQQFETDFYAKQNEAFGVAVAKQGLDLDKATDLATRGAQTLGIDPKSPLFKNADVRLACIRFTNLVAEDRLIAGEANATQQRTELEQARDIMGNPQNPDHKAWSDPMDPRHETVRARWNELYRIDGEKKRRRGET